MTDEKFHNERSLVQSVRVPVLVHIPVLRTRRERIRGRLFRASEFIATALLLTVSVAIGVYTYLAG
jgi:hypothetical protein